MDRMQLFIIGRIMGWLTVAAFIVAAINPILKLINKKIMMKRPRDNKLRKGYQLFLRNYLKVHPYIGLASVATMLVHLWIQFSFYGFSLGGFVAGISLLLVAGLGAYGYFYKKKKPGLWLTLHRWLTLVMLVAVILHVVAALV